MIPRNCIEQGVEAIFAVTNFWEHMFMGSTALEARDKEVEQGMYFSLHSCSLSGIENQYEHRT